MPKNSKARNVRLKHRKALAKLKEREQEARRAVAPPPAPTPPARPTRPSRARPTSA